MRTSFRLCLVGLHMLGGVLQMALWFPWLSRQRQLARISAWSAQLLKICGVRLLVNGVPPVPEAGPLMLAANHISWLDVFAVNAVVPARFVAKAEVAHWPVAGYLARKAGTVFVSRERSGGTSAKVAQTAQALCDGEVVAIFPEGTTTVGDVVLPFKSSFFQIALDHRAKVMPVLCRYPLADGGLNEQMAYCGDTSFVQSLRAIVAQPQSVVVLDFLPPLAAEGSRRELAAEVRAQLAAKLAESVPMLPVAESGRAQAAAEWSADG